MALKKKGGLAVLQRHYDKVVAVAVLFGLLVSLLYLSQSARRRQADSVGFDRALGALTPLHPKAEAVDATPYQKAQALLDTPFQMQPATNRPYLVAQERVWCVECRQPILFTADVCPLCKAVQPKSGPIEGWDSDNDGIPDDIETKAGLNPVDPADAGHDLDGDGFTNLEEHRAGTGLNDPASHPPRIAFLRVKEIQAVPFPLVLRGTMRGPDGGTRYQINERVSGQTYYVNEGQDIGNTGFKITKVTIKKKMVQQAGWTAPREVEVHVVTVTKGTTSVELVQDAPEAQGDYVVTFICTKDRTAADYVARQNEAFSFDNEPYEVMTIDTARRTVVIRRVSDKQEIAVPVR